MENNKDERSSILSVRDIENSMPLLAGIFFLCLILAYLYELLVNKKGCFISILYISNHTQKIFSIGIIIVITYEGADIMFRRLRERLKQEDIIRAEGIQQGIQQGKAESEKVIAEKDRIIAEKDKEIEVLLKNGSKETKPSN